MPTTTYHPWIAGQGHPGGRPTEPVHNPWTGAVEAEAAVATAEDLERAIAAAVTAFPAFRATPPRQRREILERCARRLDAERDGLARTIALEVGKPITQALGEVDRAVLTFSLAADAARAPEGEVLSLGFDPRYPAGVARTRRVPLGPVAAIAPFNYPLNLVAHKVAPALAVGAPVVLKPAPQGPGAAFRLAEILAECGLPAGALSVLHLPVPLAESLATDPRLPVLTFTGSAAVGWHLRARAATKRVLLELGGNGATVVHEDWGHPGAVAAKVVGAAFAYAGQVCTKTQRLLVHAPIADEVREAVVAAARALPVGDPLRLETVVGPVIDDKAAERISAWVVAAEAAGARALLRGTREGRLLRPTVLDEVPVEAKVWSEEIFGPVLVLDTYDEWDEALAKVNASRYGLQAGVLTRDPRRIARAFDELAVGAVIAGDVSTVRADNFPFGGTKASGNAREGVRYAMEELTEWRTLVTGT